MSATPAVMMNYFRSAKPTESPIADADALLLLRHFRLWPAAVLAAAKARAGGATLDDALDAGYGFAETSFSWIPFGSAPELLSRWVLAGELTRESLIVATNSSHPDEVVATLLRVGGIEASDEPGRWHLALDDRLARVLNSETARRYAGEQHDVHRRLAKWRAARGDHVRALFHAVQGQDWNAIQRTLASHWDEILSADRQGIINALNALPPGVLGGHPLWAAARDALGRSDIGSSGGQRPATDPHAENRLHDVMRAGTQRMVELRDASDLAGASRVLYDTKPALEDVSATPAIVQVELPRHRFEWAVTHALCGRVQESLDEFRLAYNLALGRGDITLAGESAAYMALFFALNGAARTAEEWLLRSPANSGGAEQAALARGLIAISALAKSDLDAVLKNSAGERSSPLWAVWAYLDAKAALLWEDAGLALTRLRQLSVQHSAELVGPSTNGHLVAAARADLLTAIGKPAKALEALTAVPQVRELGPFLDLVRLRTRAALGDGRAATIENRKNEVETWSRRYFADQLLWESVALIAFDEAAARNRFAEALDVLLPDRLYISLARLPRQKFSLLAQVSGALPAEVMARVDATNVPSVATDLANLSRTEREVLNLLGAGRTITEIAADRFVSVNTVKTQLRSLYRKLGVSSRAEAERLAFADRGASAG